MNLDEVRQKYPQYSDMPDDQLAIGVHKKFYADLSFEDFSERVGYSLAPVIETPPQPVPEPSAGFIDTTTQPESYITGIIRDGISKGVSTLQQKAIGMTEDLAAEVPEEITDRDPSRITESIGKAIEGVVNFFESSTKPDLFTEAEIPDPIERERQNQKLIDFYGKGWTPEGEAAFTAKNPTLSAVRQTILDFFPQDIVPGMKWLASPAKWESFKEQATEKQTLDIIGETALWMTMPPLFKGAGALIKLALRKVPGLKHLPKLIGYPDWDTAVSQGKIPQWFYTRWRMMSNKERGLMVQNIDDVVKSMEVTGASEADILRTIRKAGENEKAFDRFAKTQKIKPEPTIEPVVPPITPEPPVEITAEPPVVVPKVRGKAPLPPTEPIELGAPKPPPKKIDVALADEVGEVPSVEYSLQSFKDAIGIQKDSTAIPLFDEFRTFAETVSGKSEAFEVWNKQRKIEPEKPTPKIPEKPPVKPEIPEVRRENLLIKPQTDDMVSLSDTKGNHIGTFKTVEEAQKWAKDNDYGTIVDSSLKAPAKEPVKAEVKVTEEQRDYSDYWNTKLKLGRKVQLVKEAGWITKNNKLTKLGERNAESRWESLSTASQNVLKRHIERLYDKPREPTPKELRDAEVAETQKKRIQKGAITIEGVAPKFEYADAEKEVAHKKYQGRKKPTLIAKTNEIITSLWHKASREYEHLEKNQKNADVGFALRQLSKQKGVATSKSLRDIIGILVNLDKNTYDVFSRKVILEDLLETAREGKDIPQEWMGKDQAETEAILTGELKRLDEYIEANPTIKESLRKREEVWDELRGKYIKAMEDIGFNVDQRFNRESYFRHQVLDYVEREGIFGTGKRLKTPAKRGFLKTRAGSTKAINYDYLEAEQEVMSQMLYDIEVAKTIKRIDDNYNIEPAVREYAKENDLTFEEAITHFEGYEAWQPREGNVFYQADSIPAKLATQLYDGVLKELDITVEDLRKVTAMGGKRKRFVIPSDVAETLNGLVKQKSVGEVIRWNRKVVTKWKQWQLTSPRRYPKYNIRNLTGDAEAAFVGNASTFLKAPRAAKELFNVYFQKQPLPEDMQDWFDRGGTESTLQAQEMGEFHEIGEFARLTDKPFAPGKIPGRMWRGYWKAARLSTDFRESILRYAAYLDYLEQMKASPTGTPKNFGGSKREEVMGLKDIKDRAFMLSNDLLGAYDRVGVAGQALRENLYPFWSWQEVNAKRYLRFAKNAAEDGTLSTKVGLKILGKGLNPYTYWKLGRFALKASAFWMMLEVYNHTMYPKEEDELPENIRTRPHIILGVDDKGETRYFNRIGTLGDILEWLGLDAAPKLVNDWFSGKSSLKDVGMEMAKSSINKAFQGLYPLAKIAGEILTDTALFPNVFEPRHVRDNVEQFARNFGLDNEYRALLGKPSRPYVESLGKLLVYKSDPLRAAYSDIYQVKKKFLKDIGKYGEGFWQTDRGDALYNWRLSLKYKDEKNQERYLQEYIALYLNSGGDQDRIKTNLKASLERMHPLSGLTEQEQVVFILQLSKDDRERLMRAYQFYVEILQPGENP